MEAEQQRRQLVDGVGTLNASSHRLNNAYSIALETESLGKNTLNTLAKQREQIQTADQTVY